MKQEILYHPTCIRTFSGRYVNVFDVKEDELDIVDIAHALSHQPRFGGHTQEFYSVAQHCLMVCDMLPDEFKLAGLLHDVSEAYIIDIPSPIKYRLKEYIEVEKHVMEVVARKFGFAWPMQEEVHKADRRALEFEWANYVLENKVQLKSPKAVKYDFLSKYYQLTNSLK